MSSHDDPPIPDYASEEYGGPRRRPSGAGITALVFAILAAPCLLYASWSLLFPSYGSGYAVGFGLCGAVPLSLIAAVAAVNGVGDRERDPIHAKYAAALLACLWAVALLSYGIFLLLYKS
jgi:hypothetical protein